MDALARAGNRSSRRMTSSLRRSAYESGWPSEVTRSLTVVHDGGSYSVSYPDHMANAVDQFEYGTQSRPPTAVLRKHMSRINEHDDAFHADLGKYLDGVL